MHDDAKCDQEQVVNSFTKDVSPQQVNQHLQRKSMREQSHEPFDQV